MKRTGANCARRLAAMSGGQAGLFIESRKLTGQADNPDRCHSFWCGLRKLMKLTGRHMPFGSGLAAKRDKVDAGSRESAPSCHVPRSSTTDFVHAKARKARRQLRRLEVDEVEADGQRPRAGPWRRRAVPSGEAGGGDRPSTCFDSDSASRKYRTRREQVNPVPVRPGPALYRKDIGDSPQT